MKTRHFFKRSLHSKLILPVIVTMAVSLMINLLLFGRIDRTIKRMNQVYATNIRLSELERILNGMENGLYEYLNIKDQNSLEQFQENRDQFAAIIEEIDDKITEHPARKLEYTIRRLALSYLKYADGAVEAKQAHDAASYRSNYENVQKIYGYLLSYIQALDELRFQANSANYDTLYRYLSYLELFVIAILAAVTCCLMAALYVITGNITRPLERLAEKAKEVGKGNFEIRLEESKEEDEIGMVTAAFNQMVRSINEYIYRIQENMQTQMKMKEKELAMENLLKDAQLKYFQAQIDPHFLFNTLNAGQQLAMMEDAERTYAFMENVASFFRYRLRQNGRSSTIREEIALIDSYMYIMNVRYSNEIHLEKKIDNRLLDMDFPGMVLQPIVENALRHGLNGVEWEKQILFLVQKEGEDALICVEDNGMGIAPDILEKLRSGEELRPEKPGDSGNGVGLYNVRERLKLYFDRKDVMKIESGGEGKGTKIIIQVPVRAVNGDNKEKTYV